MKPLRAIFVLSGSTNVSGNLRAADTDLLGPMKPPWPPSPCESMSSHTTPRHPTYVLHKGNPQGPRLPKHRQEAPQGLFTGTSTGPRANKGPHRGFPKPPPQGHSQSLICSGHTQGFSRSLHRDTHSEPKAPQSQRPPQGYPQGPSLPRPPQGLPTGAPHRGTHRASGFRRGSTEAPRGCPTGSNRAHGLPLIELAASDMPLESCSVES